MMLWYDLKPATGCVGSGAFWKGLQYSDLDQPLPVPGLGTSDMLQSDLCLIVPVLDLEMLGRSSGADQGLPPLVLGHLARGRSHAQGD